MGRLLFVYIDRTFPNFGVPFDSVQFPFDL